MTRSDHRERRDIKSRNRRQPILLQRSNRSKNPPCTVAHREIKPSIPLAIFIHQTNLKSASHPKNRQLQSSIHLQIIKSTSSTGTERHNGKNRRPSLLPHRRYCSNNQTSTVTLREINLSTPSATSKSPNPSQT